MVRGRDEAETPRGRPVTAWLRRRWRVVALAGVVLVVGGTWLWESDLAPTMLGTLHEPRGGVPVAPTLVAGDGETLLTIDPSRSEVRYVATERFTGSDPRETTGTTRGVAGDVAFNDSNPSASRIGEVVVDVEQLRSDSALRDSRLRHAYLESSTHRLARFVTTELRGLPSGALGDGSVEFELVGDLTLRTVTRPITWTATATRRAAGVRLTATTEVRPTEWGVGPIRVPGLVDVDDLVRLEMDVVLTSPERSSAAAPPAARFAKRGGPSFVDTVQPVLEAKCASCHSANRPAALHVPLETAADAASLASDISLVTRLGYMPPWPASDVGVPLDHDRSLSSAELQAIADWAEAGGPLDVDGDTELKPPEPTARPSGRLARLEIPRYRGVPGVEDDYRCFVLDPRFDVPTAVTGYDFDPGARTTLHHAIVYRQTRPSRDELAALEGEDDRPGWQCYVGTRLSALTSEDAPTNVAGWVPGQERIEFADGAGFTFAPDEVLVAQLHYHYDSAPTTDAPVLTLALAPRGRKVRELVVGEPVAPVELPCVAGSTTPRCDRNVELERIAATFGPEARALPDSLIERCGADLAAMRRQTAGVATSSCDLPAGADGHIVDVYGHMHTLGSAFRMTLAPGTPREKVLLDIPVWRFEWQLHYQPRRPVDVRADDVIRIECTFDRSRRDDPEPNYITFAEGTDDEMCFGTFTIDPDAG